MLRWLTLPFVVGCTLLVVNSARGDERASAAQLAARIDALLEQHWQTEGIQLAPRADDAEFLRRAYLDLNGRIPRVSEVREFLSNDAPVKRAQVVEQLLDSPRFAVHFANVWRAELLPETMADRGAGVFRVGFEAWLQDRARAGVAYDALVRELLTAPIAQDGQGAEPVLRDPVRPNPLAFYAVKDAKPENLAAAVTRTFLGLRMECAQCHDHPFAAWSQDQFWQQAAFFASVQRQGAGMFAPLVETVAVRHVTPPEKDVAQAATFLVGDEPDWSREPSPRAMLAAWITARDNPYFARAGANRIWAQFFGRGIVEPVDDFRDDNPPIHPKLLEELAQAFAASGFDIRYLMRAICLTDAYQRSSVRTDASQDRTALPARMPLKSLTGEQFFDSIALATGYRDQQDKGAARRLLQTRFARGAAAVDPETSVQQALTLLNGSFTDWAANIDECPTLVAIDSTPGLTLDEQIDGLYLAVLGRLPAPTERAKIATVFDASPEEDRRLLLADVFWALLASAEFRMNH